MADTGSDVNQSGEGKLSLSTSGGSESGNSNPSSPRTNGDTRKRRNSFRRMFGLRKSGERKQAGAAFPGLKTKYVMDAKNTEEDLRQMAMMAKKEQMHDELTSLGRSKGGHVVHGERVHVGKRNKKGNNGGGEDTHKNNKSSSRQKRSRKKDPKMARNKSKIRSYVYTTNGKIKLSDEPLPEGAKLDDQGNPLGVEDLPDELISVLKGSLISLKDLEDETKRGIIMNCFRFLRISSHLQYARKLGKSSHSKYLPEEEETLVEKVLPPKLYKITNNELGQGAFGKVFQAKVLDKKSKMSTVAVKVLPHKTEKEKASNLNELRFLSRCNHENIVKYYNSYVVGDDLWVVLENMEGGTLHEGAQDYKEAHIAYIARAIVRALHYLHDTLNIIHRDLKSENIMMTIHGDVKLIDFGLAEDISKGGRITLCGSPYWMAPEMIQLQEHSKPADIWGAAISLLELANQEPPCMDDAMRAMYTTATGQQKTVFKSPENWSSSFKDFLGKCLVHDPEKRATAAELLDHPFLKKACSKKTMREVFETVFLRDTLKNAGLDFL